jgi:hypothetical protein
MVTFGASDTTRADGDIETGIEAPTGAGVAVACVEVVEGWVEYVGVMRPISAIPARRHVTARLMTGTVRPSRESGRKGR